MKLQREVYKKLVMYEKKKGWSREAKTENLPKKF